MNTFLRGATLRRQLVVAVALLLVVAAVAITIVTTLAMRTVLLRQLDVTLADTGRRAGQGPGFGFDRGGRGGFVPGPDNLGDLDEDPLRCLRAAGQGAGTLCGSVAMTADTTGATDGVTTTVGVLTADGASQVLTAEQTAPLTAAMVDGRPTTVQIPGLGRYRILAVDEGGAVAGVTGVPLEDVDEAIARTALAAAVVTLIGVLAAVMVGNALVGIALRPLQRVETIATRVSRLPLSSGEVTLTERVVEADTDTRTEVGRVGAALNRLLGHVEASLAARHDSETQVRQFVADASHELRTPLAAIRGYAELARRSREPVPADVAHALARVESESIRMTGLVSDLLLLASLDSGRPLDRESVDVSQIVVAAVGDAHVAGPDHKWVLDVPAEPLTVVGDAPRLHQVVANLLTNARVHTPPGTVVVTGLAATPDGRWVVLSVADDGPGIPPLLAGSVFQRFARGDSSRSRAAGSTGLGLAIVAAVVEAHGATITVSAPPAPATGAVFRVTLPVDGVTRYDLSSSGSRDTTQT